MPAKPSQQPSASKVYRANPAPLPNVSKDVTGWSDAQMADNRDRTEVPKDNSNGGK